MHVVKQIIDFYFLGELLQQQKKKSQIKDNFHFYYPRTNVISTSAWP